MTIHMPLQMLENRHGLTTTQLYKLLLALDLTPKQALSSFYLNQTQAEKLDQFIESLSDDQSKLSLSEYLQELEKQETVFLYQCSNCNHLWLSSSPLTESKSLLHSCLRTLAPKASHSGHYQFLASGSLQEMGALALSLQQSSLNDFRKAG